MNNWTMHAQTRKQTNHTREPKNHIFWRILHFPFIYLWLIKVVGVSKGVVWLVFGRKIDWTDMVGLRLNPNWTDLLVIEKPNQIKFV